MTIARSPVIPIATAIGIVLMPAAAAAQEQEIVVTANMRVPEGFEPVRMIVGIKDLDLGTGMGVAKLEKRIGLVIEHFCGPPPRAAQWQINDSKTCRDYAWASARPQMDRAISKAKGS